MFGDKLRYMQVLLNFLSNAIKFTDEGKSIVIRIILQEIQDFDEISSQIDSSQDEQISYVKFAIEVEDSGKGISEKNLKNLFVDFGKLDEHSIINPEGTGLGLSICKRIIEQMGDKVEVKSQVGVGSTFSIIINTKIKMQDLSSIIDPDQLKKS